MVTTASYDSRDALKLGVATQRRVIHVFAQFQRDTRNDGAVNRVL